MRGKRLAIVFTVIVSSFLLVALRAESSAQGRQQSQSAAQLLRGSLEGEGAEAAKEDLRKMLEDKDRFLFEEDEFLAMGNEYLETGNHRMAAAAFQMTVEVFPQSLSALRLLAHSYYMSGDEERSLEVQAQLLSVRGKAQLADFLEKNRDSLAATAEEVIARSLEATGGREVWEAVKTMVVVFSLQDTAGSQDRMVRMYKRPSFFRQGLEGAPSFTSTDGTTFWRVQNGEWSENQSFHIRLASMDHWLLGYETMGISHEFMGFDHINGSPVYHLRRTYGDGFVEDLYFSATTNLLTEIRSEYVQGWPFMESFLSQWNYKTVEGVKIPFVFIRNLGPLEPPHGGVVEEVRINVPLDDSLFLPPESKK